MFAPENPQRKQSNWSMGTIKKCIRNKRLDFQRREAAREAINLARTTRTIKFLLIPEAVARKVI
jgi:hypothetical protein